MPYENIADLIQQNMDAADTLNRDTADVQRGLDSLHGFTENFTAELASCVESSERFFSNLQQECDTLDDQLKSHLDLVTTQAEHLQQQIASIGEVLDSLESELIQPVESLSTALDEVTHLVADFSTHATSELETLQKALGDTSDSQDHETGTIATELTNVSQLPLDFTAAIEQDTQSLAEQCDLLHNNVVQQITSLAQHLQGLGPAADSHAKQMQSDLEQRLSSHLNDFTILALSDADQLGLQSQHHIDVVQLLKTDIDQLPAVLNEIAAYCDQVQTIISSLQQLWPNYNSLMHVGDGEDS